MITSALFIDFDNAFSGLFSLDPVAAIDAAQRPADWLRVLESGSEDGRNWLIRRCYLNPTGSVPDPRTIGRRVYFSDFRPFFTRAGFEVIDCPNLTAGGKNAADIRMALDVMDALRATTRCEEFIIGSSDADFTPLLHRIRSYDRRISVLATGNAAPAYRALAHHTLDAQTFLQQLADDMPEVDRTEVALEPEPGLKSALVEAQATFEERVREEYSAASGPINLARLATSLRRDLGDVVQQTAWFGAGSFKAAVSLLDLPFVEFSNHFMWDSERHVSPVSADDGGETVDTFPGEPEAIRLLATVADLPRLSPQAWAQVFESLHDYAAEHEFNLTESTRWTRDDVASHG